MKKITLFILLFCSISFANSYYVQENKSGYGTFLNPFGSIQKAIDVAQDGDSIFLRKGNYHEEVVISKEFLSPIVITSYNNEKVIIDGTIDITANWKSTNNSNIFVTTLTQNIWQLFKDGEEQVPARWPNASFKDGSVFSLSSWQQPNNSSTEINGTVNDTDLLDLKGKNIVGAMAILNTGSFRTYVRKVLTQADEQFTYTPTSAGGYKDKGHHYFLEDALSLLDTLDEWYFDSTSKKLYVFANDKNSLDNSLFKGKTQNYAFTISNSSNVIIDNLKFFATTFYISQSKNITVKNCHFAFPNTNMRMLGSEDAPKVTTIMNKSNEPPSNINIFNNVFEYTDGEGLVAKATGLTLKNNIFHDIDWSCGATQGLGVTINLSSCLSANILNNTVYKTGASSTFSPGNESTIMYNKIWNTGALQGDGSVFQCTKNQVANSEIAYNLIFDTPKYAIRYDAPGDDPTVAGKNGKMHHNIAFNSKGLMIKGDQHHIYNNSVFNTTGNGMIILAEENSNKTTKIFNNLVQKMAGHRSKNISEYPLPTTLVYTNWNGYEHSDSLASDKVADYTTFDFTPISSDIIDKGSVIDGLPISYKGTAPDIGAIESGADEWTAGANIQYEPYPWDATTTIKKSIPVIINSSLISPNPAVNYVNIKQETSWVLLTSKGKFIKKGTGSSIDISKLPPNIYYILINGKYYSFAKCK